MRTIARRCSGRVLSVGSIWVLGIALLGGCKTDSLSDSSSIREKENAPVTRIDAPEGIDVPNISTVNRAEVDLVEEMMRYRAMYHRYLEVLVRFYSEHGNEEKANWARRELRDLQHVKPYQYLDDAIVPLAKMRPVDSIAEADRLYQDGLALMKKGGHGVPGLYNQETMKLALAKFNELIDRYPRSDKIDDAAFYIGEIHKEYFEELDNSIAVKWYKSAIEWNPDLPYPARFQMAVVYDYRMHDREQALYWYQQVLEQESEIEKTNTMFANNRIRELTSERTRHASGDVIRDTSERVAAGGEAAAASPRAPSP
jgi:tetratricopeptide (TPR) repeat protein